MGIEAIGPIGGTTPVTRVTAPPVGGAQSGFASALQRQLDQPRAEIAQIRAEVSSLRDGGALRHLPARPADGATSFSSPAEVTAFLRRSATGDSSDPYGWRDMARQIGETVIGPGYGALFERQIQQESGFAPDVVTGRRRSSAGAEGIAQLMPQYYPHVNRTDPEQSLRAGAQTMQQHLQTWGGDVRKALASYNAGAGRVQSAVAARGTAWEAALPQETREYLAAIVGGARPMFPAAGAVGGLAGLTARGMAGIAQGALGGSLRALGGLAEPAP